MNCDTIFSIERKNIGTLIQSFVCKYGEHNDECRRLALEFPDCNILQSFNTNSNAVMISVYG